MSEKIKNKNSVDGWYSDLVEATSLKSHIDALRQAYDFAWKNSDDTSTKTGSVLLQNNKILLSACNHFPLGTEKIPGAMERPKKYVFNNHAERALIYKAAKGGIKTDGLTMVMPWLPCVPCANSVIFSGIKKLVVHKQMVDRTPENWDQELREALQLLNINGVKILMYDGKVGNCKALFREVEWVP